MASGGDRTEKATPKRRADARRKGQVARSQEVNTAVVLAATVGVLVLAGPRILHGLEQTVREGLIRAGDPDNASGGRLPDVARACLTAVATAVLPFAVIALVTGSLASVAQVRLRFSPEAIKPSWRKLDPVAGIKRILGPNGLFEGGKAIVKTAVVGIVALLAVWPALPRLGSLVGISPRALPAVAGTEVVNVAIRAVAALAVLAVLDYLWQRYRHEKSLRMTREEVRLEVRQNDLAPEVRGQIRRRQAEAARRRMMADIPTADVVVTNPTHYAVALRYDGTKPAPEVVARGADNVAAAIRQLARDHGVPLLSNPPLARALYRDVPLGSVVPERLFAAVAEVLAFVYRTSGRRRR